MRSRFVVRADGVGATRVKVGSTACRRIASMASRHHIGICGVDAIEATVQVSKERTPKDKPRHAAGALASLERRL